MDVLGKLMLRYVNVTKQFGGIVAVNDVSIHFEPGKIYALLGPNGSGKSTLMKLALGVIKPDFGKIFVGSVDPSTDPISARKIVGYSPEDVILYESLTPAEHISFVGSIYGLNKKELDKRVKMLIKLFKMNEHMNKLVGELSRGNKKKLSLILALLHDPKILILDEPFSGLDPEIGRVLKELMKKHAKESKVVLFSTHILELAEAVADEIAIMHRGKIIEVGSKMELRDKLQAKNLEDVFMEVTGLSTELKDLLTILWGAE